MKFVVFCHSFVSCWNHGNAHFLRGVARELVRAGHRVTVCEPASGWSRDNLVRDHGAAALPAADALAPGVELRAYGPAHVEADSAVQDADVVLVHEWSDPALVARLGRRRANGGRFRLLFHDTHHRAVTDEGSIAAFELDGYDAVLAFGAALRETYVRRGWGRQAFTWHEAADTALFRPLPQAERGLDLIWIGNWGDGERDRELQEFLLAPVARLGLRARIYGVRYPQELQERLRAHRIDYGGWLPNHRAPAALAGARLTVHVPRRPYVETLRGIPTIRVFEALACGVPLVSAPWSDEEGLFPPGSYRSVASGAEMTAALALLLRDPALAAEQARIGLTAIAARHTCAHRVAELMSILQQLGASSAPSQPQAPVEQAA